MPIDASIISGLKPITSNPLEVATQAQGLAGGILQNRLLGLNLQTQQATQPAQIARANADSQLAQVQAQSEKLGLNDAEKNVASSALLPIIQQLSTPGPDGKLPVPDPQMVSEAILKNVTAAGGDQNPNLVGRAQAFIKNLPSDPTQLVSTLKGMALLMEPTPERLAMLNGTPTNVDTGSNIVNQQISPLTGEQRINADITKGRTPSERANLVQVFDPVTKTYKLVPSGTLIGDGSPGGGPQAAAAPGGGNGGATPPAATPGASGGLPGAVAQAGPAIGEAEAITGQALDSQKQFAADTNDAGGFSQRMLGLNNAETALRKAQTGKGGQVLQDWGALVNTVAPGMLSEADKSKIKNFDEAKKYLTDYANRRGAALGIGTDAGREMVHAANPSVDINQAAATDIIKVIRGMERMQNAQVQQAGAAGVTPGNYSTWRAGWNRSVDPAGFMADQIPAAQRVKQYDAMSKPQQARYAKAVKAAVDAGYFTLDDLRK